MGFYSHQFCSIMIKTENPVEHIGLDDGTVSLEGIKGEPICLNSLYFLELSCFCPAGGCHSVAVKSQ